MKLIGGFFFFYDQLCISDLIFKLFCLLFVINRKKAYRYSSEDVFILNLLNPRLFRLHIVMKHLRPCNWNEHINNAWTRSTKKLFTVILKSNVWMWRHRHSINVIAILVKHKQEMYNSCLHAPYFWSYFMSVFSWSFWEKNATVYSLSALDNFSCICSTVKKINTIQCMTIKKIIL